MINKIFVFQLTYEIDSCKQSSDGDDDDKQQLFADFFLSCCGLEFKIFSSSVVVFVAGKHNGGGGNFFDRDKQFFVEEFVSIRSNLIVFTRFLFF